MRGRNRAAILPIVILAGSALSAGTARAQTVRLRPALTPVYNGGETVPLDDPAAVVCSPDALVVADRADGRLVRFDVAAGVVTPAGVVDVSEFSTPTRLQWAEGGGLWVLDGRTHRIGRIDAAGAFQGYLDAPGLSDWTVIPKSFRVGPDGNLYLLDVRGRRVAVHDPDGTSLREIGFPEDLRFASDLAVASNLEVFVVDGIGRKVYAAARDQTVLAPLSGDLSEHLDYPSAIVADERGVLLLADEHGGGIVVLGRDGSFRGRQSAWGWKIGMLRYPSDLCAAGGRLFVADRGNRRVQTFDILE